MLISKDILSGEGKDFFVSGLKTNQLLYIVLGSLAISILGIIYTIDIRKWVDIGLADEAKYLGDGLYLLKSKLDSSWGPLYSVWYFMLNLISNDPIDLYYLNYQLMTILPCIALYIFLLIMKVTPAFCFYFSFSFLISMINFPTWPKVSHFCLIVLFIGLILIYYIKEKNNKLLVSFLLSIVLTFIRPEFLVSGIILFGITLYHLIRNDFGWKRIIIMSSAVFIFILIFGVPYSADRNLTAFGQAYNKYLNFNERVDVYGSKGWQKILDESFDNPHSVQEAFWNNSNRFLTHLYHNLVRLPKYYFSSFNVLLLNTVFPINHVIILLILLLFIFFLIIFMYIGQANKYTTALIKEFSNNKMLFAICLILSFPPVFSVILYYPRAHYILLFLPLIYLFISLLIIPLKFKSPAVNFVLFCIFILAAFLILPDISTISSKKELSNLNAIRSIKDLNIKENINLLENEGCFDVYLPANYNWVGIELKKENFKDFIHKNRVNMIYFSGHLTNSSHLNNDPSWYEFLNDPQAFDFKKLVQEGSTIYLKKGVKIN